MISIKETCPCGASFEITGTETFCTSRYKEFVGAHKICREKRTTSYIVEGDTVYPTYIPWGTWYDNDSPSAIQTTGARI